ncbi:MAG: formate dehydrogenase subunit delta [Rhodoferax sp.]|jgi:formate dehydrogenase subunit delta|uniref:formate dehydrogenase subunit delta n=1 Tax=Rhodoferax sp. TaxID=50421 RepID=UPI001B4E7C56|nr:formate dehydrogenase subunit delta [Rhodoferax sp.]MBP8285324.1 formate dehydrogenase subunit delta [Rhodoferax sp.]MBP9147251.1 formate dehydrogenase subunit delta [Rhodoferax sp.]MBP9735450.1 formate dehydrogenase subunit delta [Rhodoferax sp.]
MTPDDNLVRMANQIGLFFESMPERAEALEGIALHLKKFWDPRMRRALLARLDATAEHGLSDIVLAALQAHRGLLASRQSRF